MRANDLLWLICGVGVGAGFTLLFATRDGRRMRRRFHRRVARLVETGQGWMEGGRQVVDRSIELANDVGEVIGSKLRASNV